MSKLFSPLRQQLGVLRSIAMYYWKPFNKKRLMAFYAPFVKENALCFDIGAHLGNRTNAWEALGARVVAVEPQPQCMQFLKKKFGDSKRVTLLQKAVGAQAGTANFYLSELTPTISTMAATDWRQAMADNTSFKVSWDQQLAVTVLTLDQLIETYGLPDFCKIDVEDFEVEVLKGLSIPLPVLSFEYYTPTLFRVFECLDLLDALGKYEYNWSFGESQVFNSETWLSSSEMKKVFDTYNKEDRSGDVYARLKGSL